MAAAGDPLGLARLPLTDGVVRLRLPGEADVASLVAICDDPDVARFTPSIPSPYGELDALAWLAVQASDVASGRALHLAVDDVARGEHVGTVSLFGFGRGSAEVGYLVRPEARGRGVATRAVRLLAAHAHATLGIERLTLLAVVANWPSRLVAIRAGFREEGLLRGVPWRAGGVEDSILYGHSAAEPLVAADPLRTDALPVTDGVVALRLPRLADVPALVVACDDPEIARWTFVPSPYGPEHGAGFVLAAAGGAATGSDLMLVAVDAASDELLGAIGLHDIGGGEAEVGYWVAASARGRGVASRALALAVGHAFGSLGLHRLQADVLAGNDASLRILERAGFAREGLRRARPHRDGRNDCHVLGLLA